MNSLITGATGFIGKRLVVAVNGSVRVLSRKNQSNYETVICDLSSEVIPINALDEVDIVFHLAGFTHDLSRNSKFNDLHQKLNVDATIRLAELAVKSNVKKFVFVSSVKAGGLPNFGHCANEETQSEPDGIYGKTKREAELALLNIANESDMHVSIIRPSLVYGPDLKGNLQLMLSGIKKRWFPPLPETKNKKSMIHVDDLVRAILLVSEDDRANGEIFIATDGMPHSSREIYNTLCKISSKPIPKWHVPNFLFDIATLASPQIKLKVKKLLGDEYYSSSKLNALGFTASKTLEEISETDF